MSGSRRSAQLQFAGAQTQCGCGSVEALPRTAAKVCRDSQPWVREGVLKHRCAWHLRGTGRRNGREAD